jgi:hypothetical protein
MVWCVTLYFNAQGQSNCNCPSGLNVSGDTFSIQKALTFGVLPPGSSSIGCLSIPGGATLLVDADYTFTGTTFNMGSSSKIFVEAPYRLTLRDCILQGCEGTWQGVILEPETGNPGGELDMQDSKIRDAITGVLAQNQTRLRLVSNDFEDNINGLKITGSVGFVNHLNPNDFSNNRFYSAGATWANTAILFDNARFFNIGEDLVNPPSIVNFITDYELGVDIKNSVGISIYGVTFKELTGIMSDVPVFSKRVCVRSYFCNGLTVKYCKMDGFLGQIQIPHFGIATLFNSGRQVFHENNIRAGVLGISVRNTFIPYSPVDIRSNTIRATGCLELRAHPKKMGNNLHVEDNHLSYELGCFGGPCPSYFKGGILAGDIMTPYQLYENDITNLNNFPGANGMSGFSLSNNTGIGDVSDNIVNFQYDKTGSGLSMKGVKNCRIYDNTVSGINYQNPTGNAGIRTANSSNLVFCCNNINQTDLGSRFDMSNTDIKFYTTAYGDHERALYFPPAAALNPQLNTGNTWAGANTNLDAFYDGSAQQAAINAPFQTQISNINTSKISPQNWFTLAGTDPSCTQTSFNCPDIIPPNEFTELTEADLIALDTAGAENEHVLRFQQKRQLYRKLRENPYLAEWSQQVENFYAAAQGGIVGAFDSLDQAYEQLHELSPSLESSFTVLIQQIDSLAGVLSSLHAQYPTATPGQQQTLLEQERALNEAIGERQDDLNGLLPSVESEIENRITQLLAQNDALDATEVWEVNEKDINDLYFRHYAGLIDTFSAGEKDDIETLAFACPQYEGAGVYKARQLYEMFADSIPSYDEHDCQAAEERAKRRTANEPLTVAPNPADEYLTVRFGKSLPEGSRLVVTDITGGIVMAKRIDGASETTLNVANIPQGIYLISVYTPKSTLKTVKSVITH